MGLDVVFHTSRWWVGSWWLTGPVPVARQVFARIEAVRTALAAGAGVGAAVTLLPVVRREVSRPASPWR